MSDCRKFGPSDADRSPEERLADVEMKFGVIIERIRAYDAVLDKFKTISDRLIVMGKDQDELRAGIQLALSEGKRGCDALASQLSGFSGQLKERQVKDDAIHADLCMENHILVSQVEAQKESVKALDQRLVIFLELCVSKDKLDSYKRSQDDELDSIHLELRELSAKCTSLAQEDTELSATSAQQDLALSSSIREYRASVAALQAQVSELARGTNACTGAIADLMQTVKRQTDDQILALKTELKGSPSSLESTKAELLSQFKTAQMDASNSVLKANNSAKQIELIERKIENLALLVKKLELSNQAK